MNTLHPYLQSSLGGLLIGLASWWLLAALGRVTGISGITAALLPGRSTTPTGDRAWRLAYLLGLIGGGALFTLWLHPPVTALRPLPLLALAGLLVGFGTVLGSGCTSGHGVCGLGRRSLRSLVATATFMGAGFATVGLTRWLG
ncbi:YeeE/YedE thiosulfate transporter family protein [Curvibacter sp. HBC28]|uniref:YeeE/YedE thiosulfate transporter family protein n=2 Tax=Curvibacter microcysteis TaxID=3026419 RepID=A0ABT5MA68_9BURK|nr:YeeE/YedE thiosulfate transporter family protein [Curvibacter sp. HBC28]MDD0813476.1 YeeE/YedE thiosulfate transporter family protein [Curvibacter sp. HBC28]